MTVVQSHTIQSKKSIANAKGGHFQRRTRRTQSNANVDLEDKLRRKLILLGWHRPLAWFRQLIGPPLLSVWDSIVLNNVFPRLCFDWIWPRLGWWIVRGCIALDFTWFANFMSFQLQVVQMVHKTRLQNTVLKMQLNQLFIQLFQNQIVQMFTFLH